MFCSNCGAEVTGTYCSKCGTKIQGAASQPIPQPFNRPNILLHSRDCGTMIDASEKLVSNQLAAGIMISVFVPMLLIFYLGFSSISRELWSLLWLLIPAGIVLFVRQNKRYKEIIERYRTYCAKETLIVEDMQVYGSTAQEKFALPYFQIKDIRCTIHLNGGNQRLPKDPFCDVLQIRDTSGKAYILYSFINCKELKTIIEKQMRDAQPAPVAPTAPARPVTATVSHKADSAPVKPETAGEDIVCPVCGTRQRSDRKVCWSCAQKFTD